MPKQQNALCCVFVVFHETLSHLEAVFTLYFSLMERIRKIVLNLLIFPILTNLILQALHHTPHLISPPRLHEKFNHRFPTFLLSIASFYMILENLLKRQVVFIH